jgi:hypothetical protein
MKIKVLLIWQQFLNAIVIAIKNFKQSHGVGRTFSFKERLGFFEQSLVEIFNQGLVDMFQIKVCLKILVQGLIE